MTAEFLHARHSISCPDSFSHSLFLIILDGLPRVKVTIATEDVEFEQV